MKYLFDMKGKRCFKCKEVKQLEQFYKHSQMSDGHVNKCKSCNKLDVKTNYSTKKEYYSAYDKNRQRLSLKRILDHRYNSIRQRVEGRGIHKNGSFGKEILSREEFDNWFEETYESFKELYNVWVFNNFQRKFAPSIDRIDNNRGYVPSNMQWLSHSENSKKYTKPSNDCDIVITV